MEAFSQKGYHLSLITDTKTIIAPKFEKSIPVFVLPALTTANFVSRFVPNNIRAIRILKRIHPDIVHLHAQHQYVPAIALGGFPFTLNSWGMEVLELPNSSFLRKALAKSAAARSRKIIVDAKILKDIWADMGMPNSKIEVIPFGVDTNIFNPSVDGSSVRKRLHLKKNDVVIISTRPFYNSHYNIECLIEAIPSIVEKNPNAKFIIKGSGPREQYLRSLTEKLKIAKHVHFVGLVPHYEVARYLRAADIYVSTSYIDSTSVSLLEAMACGLAPVVADIRGNREWVQNEVNGLLFPPRDSAALAERIIQLIENEDQRIRFGERCFQVVQERATWAECVARMEAIYRELL